VAAARSRRQISEAGYSLAELAIALLLLTILFAMVAPILETITNTNTYVTDTYHNENQLLPVSTNFQKLIRSVVSPAPTLTPTSPPVPAFGVYQQTSPYGITTVAPTTNISPNTVTFFTNVGNANGPARVVAKLVGTTFTATIAYPNNSPKACPRSQIDTNTCSYPAVQQELITVTNVVNASLGQPVFIYDLSDGTVVSNPISTFANCLPASTTLPATTTCPASQIESINVDLKVNSDPAHSSQADDQTVIYELSPTSQLFDPTAG
jgi:hypothetical protein